MTQAFINTRRFRLKILANMLRPRWLATYGPIILADYFEQADEHDFAAVVLEYWQRYKTPPTDVDDLLAIMGDDATEYHDMIYSVYLGVTEWDLAFAADHAIQFAKEQAAKIAVLSSLKDIEAGELGSVVDRLRQAMKVGESVGDTGLSLKDDIDSWLAASQSMKTPTGMIHLDIAMEGGLAPGELGVFLSPPNYGKSMALINVGYGATGPIARCNVAHFSLEMSAEVVAKRYGARATFRFPNRSGNLAQYKVEFDRASIMLYGDIRIFRVNGTVDTLRSHTERLIDSGFIPDLMIVDYGDELDPMRRRADRWVELGDIFKDLRGLGYDFGCPIWTATQTGRQALNKEIITMKDVAESFKKVGVCDALVAICQTPEEEHNDQCRLFLAKLRDGKSRTMVRAKYYKEQQAIVTTGFVKYGTSD